jgi:hypothetical protein
MLKEACFRLATILIHASGGVFDSPKTPAISGSEMKDAIKTWMPIVANVATTLAMVAAIVVAIIAARQLSINSDNLNVAAKQFELAAKAQRFVNTAPILKEGRDLEQRYRDGTTDEREIVAFYYKIFLMNQDDMLVTQEAGPLLKSLEEEITRNPRIKPYWAKENHKTFSDAFVARMDGLINAGGPK